MIDEDDDEEMMGREMPLPGAEVTPELFRKWQAARRGTRPGEDLTNPAWAWMFRGRVDPYPANKHFGTGPSSPSEPRWAGCRMGRSKTRLADGRVFHIAGEHEDFYDPDFYIYNDVIVEHPDGSVQIFGYRESDFVPTDFHSATSIDDLEILLIGNAGYPADRRLETTQVLLLDVETLFISPVSTKGAAPGWISKHRAELISDGRGVLVTGGLIPIAGELVENIDDWRLDLRDWSWSRLTDRRWPRFAIGRDDGEMLHLFEYDRIAESPQPKESAFAELREKLGGDPDLNSYRRLFRPTVGGEEVATERDWSAFATRRFVVDGVSIRFVQDFNEIVMTVEGELPEDLVAELAQELRDKLSRVENAGCSIRRIADPSA